MSSKGTLDHSSVSPQNGINGGDDDDDEPIPQIVDRDPTGRFVRYAQSLGKGAYKSVYRGFDEEEGVEVAWNQLRVDHLSDKDARKLKAEVDLLRSLRHPNIIQLIHSWSERNATGQEVVYFVTELMTSGTLKKYLRKIAGKIRPKFLKAVCLQILKALNYLHSSNPPVLHRDLKCENIFVNGNTAEVKLGDLGLATVKQLRHVTSVIGTPEFMAPELYDESYDEKADIYAFGMCMLEMVTKEYPYSECSNQAQIYKRVTHGVKPDALKKIDDPVLRGIIESCLEFNPENRPSASALLAHSFFKVSETPTLGPNAELVVLPPENDKVGQLKSASSNPINNSMINTGSLDSRLAALTYSLPPLTLPEQLMQWSDPSASIHSLPSEKTQSPPPINTGRPMKSDVPAAHGNVEMVHRVDENTITIKMSCRVPGTTTHQIVKFPFNLEKDTPEEVVSEMLKEEVLEEIDRNLAVKSLQMAIRRALGLEVGTSSTLQRVTLMERSRSSLGFIEENDDGASSPKKAQRSLVPTMSEVVTGQKAVTAKPASKVQPAGRTMSNTVVSGVSLTKSTSIGIPSEDMRPSTGRSDGARKLVGQPARIAAAREIMNHAHEGGGGGISISGHRRSTSQSATADLADGTPNLLRSASEEEAGFFPCGVSRTASPTCSSSSLSDYPLNIAHFGTTPPVNSILSQEPPVVNRIPKPLPLDRLALQNDILHSPDSSFVPPEGVTAHSDGIHTPAMDFDENELLMMMEDDPELMLLWKKQRQEAEAMARCHLEEWNRVLSELKEKKTKGGVKGTT